MNDRILERKLQDAVESARRSTENWLRVSSRPPEFELREQLKVEFRILNKRSSETVIELTSLRLESVDEPRWNHNLARSTGASMLFLGQPILKKRFVLAGASTRTSIASKYLSRAFPQKLPRRVLGTAVLGRVLGRALPYAGAAIIVIDAIETTIETYDTSSYRNSHTFGGGGASGEW